ncbi:hypothetical protein [Herbaspirillum huttiense]|uniref:Uncharacterized protein n=1 Tax=Herbaspirillum huttiense subsp. lycopersici TaxID=3074428 RepID=A0ABU2EGK8_9BURK|nr:hypothetical protein [Herbaspirillum huttiense]MDR9847002.1 hypothetical protein [Herbaspirillum huttiense SE1]
MKIEVKNLDDVKVKAITAVAPTGSPESAEYDNGLRETFIEPGQSAQIDLQGVVGEVVLRAYVEQGTVPEVSINTGA